MPRSKGVTISVKVPINWDAMSQCGKQRLRQISGRDTRVIRAFIGIIEHHEDELLKGRDKKRIDDGKVDQLTITAIKVASKYPQRLVVPHDFKARFPRMASSELIECRKTAISLYESYLALRKIWGKRASRPLQNSNVGIPRWIFVQRFKLFEKPTSVSRWWISLVDSLDSRANGLTIHNRLPIPLKMSSFHERQVSRGQVKALQIFRDNKSKWWATLAVRLPELEMEDYGLPPAVLGIDLGIKKAACVTLVTPEKVRETRFFVQKDKASLLAKYDLQVANLQRELHLRINDNRFSDNLSAKLREMKNKRENIALEYDRVLCRQLLNYVDILSKKYTLYVAIGRLKNIRERARRGNGKGRAFRKMINSWSFRRITNSFKHQLAQVGWSVDGKNSRFQVVSEAWTSIICWKCGSRGRRPRQSLFCCPSCKHQTNADRNGSINIAARLIMLTESLHSVKGIGKWASAIAAAKTRSARPKSRREYHSRRTSQLRKGGQMSGSAESAVSHHIQLDLLSFGDKAGMGDNDLAVARTVESLTAVSNDTLTSKQEKEARTIGGTPFQ